MSKARKRRDAINLVLMYHKHMDIKYFRGKSIETIKSWMHPSDRKDFDK